MKDLIKAIDGLPKIVRFLGTLIWGILTISIVYVVQLPSKMY